jgi:hypothetical protein
MNNIFMLLEELFIAVTFAEAGIPKTTSLSKNKTWYQDALVSNTQ